MESSAFAAPIAPGESASVSIELNCRICGNNRFEFPDSDGGLVRCQFCGESAGTYADVKETIAKAVGNRRTSG